MSDPLAAKIYPFPAPQPHERLNNSARLTALDATGLMDTPPEEAFDRAVRLATRMLGTPVGLVSLVDGERQFFKAQTGLPDATAEARETPLSHSFCQHVVAADAPLVIRDAREDPLVQENLAIPDLGVIAYLGIPIHAPDGHVLGSFCAIQSEPRDWTTDEREILEDIASVVETEILLRSALADSAQIEAVASAAEERLRLALRAGQIGTYDFDPQTQKARWDDELYSIWGLQKDEEDVFAAVQQSIHPDDKLVWETDVEASLNPGGTGQHDLEMRFTRPDTGETRWLHTMGQASFVDGQAVRLVGTVRDITDHKAAELREQLLTQELNHRVKNLFAIVSGMISMTARRSSSPKQMGAALRGRVEALASAHALIQPAISGKQVTTTDVTLQTLASSILEPHIRTADAITLTGPPVPLNPDAASNLALVLHEMATNAAKYGALSEESGKLVLTWDTIAGDDGTAVHLRWSETGGPNVPGAPSTKGFGSTLIEMTVNSQMNGSMQTDWHPEGVRHDLYLPTASFQ
ncbi:GAF domain-containing protein [Sulfitobacter sp. S190]|uniref:GAF domain-containing protein n=1 Tax=Sulfitobacter sp. S190 TaxID=2867022 RepID=UPI0021A94321|nr:GAF domain-containing protein [Sulfitobacter sp. S190]UWR21193.1 GAF domain-containing protein [Sulfitobacter sp. S190]